MYRGDTIKFLTAQHMQSLSKTDLLNILSFLNPFSGKSVRKTCFLLLKTTCKVRQVEGTCGNFVNLETFLSLISKSDHISRSCNCIKAAHTLLNYILSLSSANNKVFNKQDPSNFSFSIKTCIFETDILPNNFLMRVFVL